MVGIRGCCSAHLGPRLPCKHLLQPDRAAEKPELSRPPAGYPVGHVPRAQQNVLRYGIYSLTDFLCEVAEVLHKHDTSATNAAVGATYRAYLQGDAGHSSPSSLYCPCCFSTLSWAKSSIYLAGHRRSASRQKEAKHCWLTDAFFSLGLSSWHLGGAAHLGSPPLTWQKSQHITCCILCHVSI